MGRYVVSLRNRQALQEKRSGGKGASLAWLGRRGFKVPPGFIITSVAFRDFLANCGIETLAQTEDWTQDASEQIRDRILAACVPDRLARSIVKAYRQLGAPAAVRSSMVGEDGKRLSFAGQLDTVLNVRQETEVLEAVKRCWASMFSWRNVNYLTECESEGARDAVQSLSMAVVVQRMVEAKAAGVAFSADPLTGQRCVVIEAARGLGNALVAGLVQPDRHIVDARGVLAETTLANPDAPALTEGQVMCLADIVRQLARRLGTPQDVEWAWDGSQFWVLQSRPITSLEGQTVYSNKMVSDMAPGLITPLVYSTKIVAMAENVFGRIFTELLGPSDTEFKLLVARIHSRVYTNVTLLGDLFEQIGMPPNFFESMSRGERADMRRPPLTLRTMRAFSSLAAFAWRHSRIAGKIEAFVKRHDRQLDRYRGADWTGREPQELLVAFDRLMCLHGELQWHIFIGPINMMVRNRLLDRLVAKRVEDVAASDLIRGLVGLKALEPNEELRRLAMQAQALDDDMQCSLIARGDKAIRQMLLASGEGRELVQGVEAFLDRYGFLSPNGTDFAATPWIENPTLIWHAIGRYAASPPQLAIEDMEGRREAARERVRAQLSMLQRAFFDRLLASTITYIDLRERTSFLMSEDSLQMRRIFLALADHFVARGDLDRRTDIFYLFYPEVRQLGEGALDGHMVRQLVAERRAEMEADAETELPETVCGTVVPSRLTPSPSGQEYLVGISGSSGVAEGYARIIFDPAEVPAELTRDDILVVPFTDVGWTPLFPGIGGIVAETGGQLSHTSIVAREYGLPAVVGVKQVTRILAEGQAITVDGDAGRVYLKHSVG
jgi:pyruvate,water dikinase